MIAIFGIFYLILFLFFTIAALFIVYHVIKYSFSKSVMVLTLTIFLSVFGALLFSNLMLFLSLRWDEIFSNLNL
ncbi:MAG: hypothetical protein NT136_00175 [Candidatus Moranbacteria bacterium]|nr:hypothetical protein [Candidatus Moranbacteria bacterium]